MLYYNKFHDMMPFYNEVWEIWEKSEDKEGIERMFRLCTGMWFEVVFKHLGKIK